MSKYQLDFLDDFLYVLGRESQHIIKKRTQYLDIPDEFEDVIDDIVNDVAGEAGDVFIEIALAMVEFALEVNRDDDDRVIERIKNDESIYELLDDPSEKVKAMYKWHKL